MKRYISILIVVNTAICVALTLALSFIIYNMIQLNNSIDQQFLSLQLKIDDHISENENNDKETDTSSPWIQTNSHYYRIEELPGLFAYQYEIYFGDETVAQGVDSNVNIIDYGGGFLSLYMHYGSNENTLQLFDCISKRKSPIYRVHSNYDLYIPTTYNLESVLIAYFKMTEDDNVVLCVADVFSDWSTEIEGDDFPPVYIGPNNIVFLNENEVYIEYNVYGEDYEIISIEKKIISFR